MSSGFEGLPAVEKSSVSEPSWLWGGRLINPPGKDTSPIALHQITTTDPGPNALSIGSVGV
jgi:hypothetical protein